MSLKEIAYGIVNNLSNEQLKGFIMLFSGGTNLEIPNEELLEAFEEVEEMKKHPEKYKGYTDLDEMMRDLSNED